MYSLQQVSDSGKHQSPTGNVLAVTFVIVQDCLDLDSLRKACRHVSDDRSRWWTEFRDYIFQRKRRFSILLGNYVLAHVDYWKATYERSVHVKNDSLQRGS